MRRRKGIVAILCCLSMMLLGVRGTTLDVEASGTGTIQLNGMKETTNGDGWVLYGTLSEPTADAGRVRMSTPSTDVGAITEGGGQNKTEFTNLQEDLDYVFTVEVNAGYTASASSGGQPITLTPVDGQEGSYTFTIHVPVQENSVVVVDVSFSTQQDPNPPGPGGGEQRYIDIKIGNTVYQRVTTGELIKGDFDINNLNFQVIKYYESAEDMVGVELTNCKTQGFIPDAEGRNPMEVRTVTKSDTSVTINIENHDNPMFYFTNITFAKNGTSFVGFHSSLHPFMYQDTVSTDKVALSADASNPTEFTSYYGSETVSLNNPAGEAIIQKIEVAEDIASGAITISGNEITFHSSFYNSVILKVTLEDETVGYIKINRIGIEIADYEFGNANETRPDGSGPLNCAYHGSQNGQDLSDAKYNNQHNVIASFYFDSSTGKTGSDYDVISIATFADGHTETSICEAVTTDIGAPNGESIKVADYIVWTGNKTNTPVKVSVTAVNHGAVSNATNFGGAKFGAGLGVTKVLSR